MLENDISYAVIGAAIRLHMELGPGLLESAYEHGLLYELREAGLFVRHQVSVPFKYKESTLQKAYSLDLLVEEKVIIEIKAVPFLIPIYSAQLMTYLKLTNLKLGLLINFNTRQLVKGVRRVVHEL